MSHNFFHCLTNIFLPNKDFNKEFVANVKAPVCIAGSVNSFARLDEIKSAAPWTFTIGGAFFENKFAGTFEEQINKVCEYING